MREFTDDATDMIVKVLGGSIAIRREYKAGKWQWDHLIRMTEGKAAAGKPEDVAEYVSKGEVPYKKISPGVFKNQTFTIEHKGSGEPYLFKDKNGNWQRFDAKGRLLSYGRRQATIATLLYENDDATTPKGIADRNGVQVFWFEHNADKQLVKVGDKDKNEVTYAYSGADLVKVTDVLKHDTRYEYSGGKLTKTIDAAGRATIVAYDKDNAPVSVTDSKGKGHFFAYRQDGEDYYAKIKTSAGQVKEVWYNRAGETKKVVVNGRAVQQIEQNGRTHRVTDEQGRVTVKEYDEQDNLIKIIHPDKTEISFEQDERFNKPKSIKDQRGHVTAFAYDDQGNLIRKTEAKGTAVERTTAFTYNEDGQVLTITTEADKDTEATVTTFTYDGNGNLTSITDPIGGKIVLADYTASGSPKKMRDARGNDWIFSYDALSRLTSQTNPVGDSTSFEYDNVNNRTAVINAYLKRFEFEYDEHNNLIKAIDPYKKYVSIQHNSDNLPTQTINQEQKKSSREYDSEGRLVETVDGADNAIKLVYAEGATAQEPSSVIYPTFTRTFTYDSMGRAVKETDELDRASSQTRSFAYDPAGNLISSADEQGNVTAYEYDALNRLSKETAPDGGVIRYVYDNRDNLLRVEDPNQGITAYSYDKNSRLVKSARPMGQETRYEYDASGNRTAVVDAKNQRIEYEYDPLNRLTRMRYYAAANSHAGPVKTVHFTYDKIGKLLTWDDGARSGAYTYDDLSRKTAETVNYGAFSLTNTYAYYADGLLKSFTGPDKITISYAYDQNSRLTGISIPGQGKTAFTYSRTGWNSPVSMTLPGKAQQEYAYDPLLRLKSITAKGSGQNPLLTRAYEYSAAGDIIAKATEHGKYAYSYDSVHRLTKAANPILPEEIYTYDKLGNRLTDSIQGSLKHNANNELLSADAAQFAYDANGNLVKKTSAGQTTEYVYDLENRLVQVKGGSGAAAGYSYDPFGRRLWKEVGGVRTYFHYSDQGLAGEYGEGGKAVKTYGYKPGSPWMTAPLFLKAGDAYYFYHNDHLGTPQKLTDAQGAVVWSATYSAFLEAKIDPAAAVVSNLRGAGQYFDEETGLYYNWNRYYDPKTGRYLGADPLEDTLNLYIYSLNNPNLFIDPLGLCAMKDPHNILDILGFVPGLGAFPDLLNASLYAIEGDYLNAALSGLSAIPVAEYIVRGGGRIAKELSEKGTRQNFLPVMTFDWNATPELAENIWHAQQAGNPNILTHGGNTRRNRRKALKGIPSIGRGNNSRHHNLSRDEYPFASSKEGGCGSWIGHVPEIQQDKQGEIMRNFFKRNNIKPGDNYRVDVINYNYLP